MLLFIKERLIERRQLFRRDVVLARQRNLTGNALFQLKQAIGIEIQTFTVVAQFITGFRDLNRRLFQHIQHAGQFAVHARQLGNKLTHVIQLALQINVFTICQ